MLQSILSKQKWGLRICHINAQSLLPKIDEFRDIFVDSDVDVICVTETWLRNDFNDEICRLEGYRVFRFNRSVRVGGGVAIYVKCSIKCKLKLSADANSNIEYLFVDIKGNDGNLLLGAIYRPNKNIDFSPLFSVLEEISVSSPNIILCGDFNCNLLNSNILVHNMETFNLKPVNIGTPTHYFGRDATLLDLMFVSNLNDVALYDQLSAPAFSKHDLIFATLRFSFDYSVQKITYRDFHNINVQELEEHTRCTNWDAIYFMPSSNDQIEFLTHNIANLFNNHVPLKTKILKSSNKPWFTENIRLLMQQRDEAYKNWKCYRLNELRRMYCSLRNKVVAEIRILKSQHLSRKLSVSLSGRALWNNLRNIGIGKSRTVPPEDIDGNILNEKFVSVPMGQVRPNNVDSLPSFTDECLREDSRFGFSAVTSTDVVESMLSIKSKAVGLDDIHPSFLLMILPIVLPYITYAFNTILMTGVYPDLWKAAKIIPFPKTAKGDEFRPISILPFLSKVFEKVLQKQINCYLTMNSMLTQKQSGFRKKHSCITALLKVTDDLRQALDNDEVSFLVLLDFSKAFDTVNHVKLCRKLFVNFNFSSGAAKLIFSYLSNRKQAVLVGDSLSNFLPNVNGVPQGSILGPLLFSMYVNELPSIISNCSSHMYADDVQLYFSCPLGLIEHGAICVNEDLEKVVNWSELNGLILNPKKSNCLVISRKSIHLDYFPPIVLSNAPIDYVETAKNLGVTFNRFLTWDNHINALVGKVYGVLRTLWVTQGFTPVKTRLLLAKTLIIPILIYGCEIYCNCNYISKRKLNVAFNSTVRYVYGLRRYDRVSGLASQLLDMSFDQYVEFRSLTLLADILFSRQPQYCYEKIIPTSSHRSRQLIVPRFSFLTSERQFFVNSVRLWNSLPRNIKDNMNETSFKKVLKSHFSASLVT